LSAIIELQTGIAEEDLLSTFRVDRRDKTNSVAARPLMVQ